MSWLLGILGVLGGLVAATWAAYRHGGAEQRARTLEALREAAVREAKRRAERDAEIERARLAAIEAAKKTLEERRDEAKRDIDEAERKLRERTRNPWPPK